MLEGQHNNWIPQTEKESQEVLTHFYYPLSFFSVELYNLKTTMYESSVQCTLHFKLTCLLLKTHEKKLNNPGNKKKNVQHSNIIKYISLYVNIIKCKY